MTKKNWEDKFELLLENYLIDVPDEYFAEDVPLKTPQELQAIFSELEGDNLFIIH